MQTKKAKIAYLQREVEEKDAEIKRLKEMLGLYNSECHCKSGFCTICKHFMGIVEGVSMCNWYDEAPCDRFEFNGCPSPDFSSVRFNTEIVNDYILGLTQKRDNRRC